MIVAFEEYKTKLDAIKPELDGLGEALDLEGAERELDELRAQTASDGFWDNVEKARKVQQRLSRLEDKIASQQKRLNTWEDLRVLCEMGQEEEDASLVPEVQSGYEALEKEITSARMDTLLSGTYDNSPAIISLQPGAGGTEAQDWAEMLYRMYTRWVEQHGYTYTILDYQEGDGAGIKSAVIRIEGDNAYGHLKSEHGVHRLVRISPFDANARRQTSFAAVEVTPELDDSIEVDIRPEDIEMQVYRSSGAGGQHINKTSSAVRLIHKPTGLVVSCQTERSQVQNRETCMKMLRSKLMQIKEQEHLDKISDIKGIQLKIEWGSQIRSYVFMPYQLVKDNRTGFETSNVNGVMDGDLDGFINAYLTAAATGNWATK